jgi:hypothetical protein
MQTQKFKNNKNFQYENNFFSLFKQRGYPKAGETRYCRPAADRTPKVSPKRPLFFLTKNYFYPNFDQIQYFRFGQL